VYCFKHGKWWSYQHMWDMSHKTIKKDKNCGFARTKNKIAVKHGSDPVRKWWTPIHKH
jgi:hypothetical protein